MECLSKIEARDQFCKESGGTTVSIGCVSVASEQEWSSLGGKMRELFIGLSEIGC